MSRLSSSGPETPGQSAPEPVPYRNGTAGDARETAGAPGSSANQESSGAGASHADADPSRLDRVEEMMDEIGKKVGSFTSQLGVHLFRLVAHGREAAEDCWAEAQSIRRGEPQQEQTPEERPPTS